MSWRTHYALLASLLVAACGTDNMADLRDYVREVKERKPGPIEPLPEIKPVDTYVYEPGDRRDPFVMDTEGSDTASVPAATSDIAPDPLRRKEELEQYSLDALRMLGTLQQDDVIWGLIRSPDGILHRVRVGNYVGKNNGQITRISEEEIELTEIVEDGINNWRERRAAIALSE